MPSKPARAAAKKAASRLTTQHRNSLIRVENFLIG
jgi:hypothetical protein